MALLSIKRYLNGNLDNPWREGMTFLIEKIGDYAIDRGAQELEEFRAELRGISHAMVPDLPAENAVNLAAAAAQLLEAYNRRIAAIISKEEAGFQTIMRMLHDTLVRIGGANAQSVERFSKITEELESGVNFKDLPSIKEHLRACLSGLREQIEREKAASSALIEKLQMEIGALHQPNAAPPPIRKCRCGHRGVAA